MSSRLHPHLAVLRVTGSLLAGGSLLLIAATLLDRAVIETLTHLVAGWLFFLRRNLPAILHDPGVLASGALATLAAAPLVHLLARSFFGRKWKGVTSLGVVGLLFALFAASFILPGILLILRTPMDAPWLDRSSGSRHVRLLVESERLASALRVHVEDENATHFPDSLAILREAEPNDPDLAEAELEGYLYPAAGLPVEFAAEIPLILSPPFQRRGKPFRIAIHGDMLYRTLTPDQVEAALAATEALATRP